MTGCVALRKDVYYVRLSYYDKDHIRKDKFISTGLSSRGAKQKATASVGGILCDSKTATQSFITARATDTSNPPTTPWRSFPTRLPLSI